MFWNKAEGVAARALALGELMPITTEAQVIEEDNIRFLGHVVTANAGKKPIASKAPIDSQAKVNPFLPYEPDLYVAEAGENYVCLLNKFPVLSPHLLICSKAFIPQVSALTIADFEAWILGFDKDDVLGFYNCGPVAGASQAHRHMQLVKTDIPLAARIKSGQLPFKHERYLMDAFDACTLHKMYLHALAALDIGPDAKGECRPYNLLLTREWMLVLPRTTNNIEGVFANGINYSGRFLVKREEQLAWLKEYGLMNYLTHCGAVSEI